MRPSSSLLLASLILPVMLGGCEALPSQPMPDNRIRLLHGQEKTIALPPECVDWNKGWGHTQLNNQWPSYGCAQARNLAAMIENPDDLKQGRELGPAEPITSTAAIARYQSGKTAPLIDPNKDIPEEVKKLEDKRIGGAPQK